MFAIKHLDLLQRPSLVAAGVEGLCRSSQTRNQFGMCFGENYFGVAMQAQDAAPAPSAGEGKRMKNVVIERGIVYGTESIALYPGQSPPDGMPSHRWKVYVRGPRHEDISHWVKRVVFTLHSSFVNPRRVVDAPPFELTEVGWGEFEISISIHFTDATEKPIEVYHLLKLFAPEGTANWPEDKPVVSERLDQIVFNDPTEWFYNELIKFKQEDGPPMVTLYAGAPVEDDAQLEKILLAQKRVREEIWKLKEKYEETAAAAAQIRRQIDSFEAAERAAVRSNK